jgi:hypothetical protein
MKRLFAIALLLPLFSWAQNSAVGTRHIGLSVGRTVNGSGDMDGFVFNSEFSKRFKGKLSWSAGLGGTIHDSEDQLFFTYNGREYNSSIRSTVAGFQIVGHLGYKIISSPSNELTFRLGPLFRYQSSSLPDDVTILYPPATNLPIPVIYFNHSSPIRTYSAGGSAQIFYQYTFNNHFSIGAIGGVQYDSQGDIISQTSFFIGKRF